LSIFTIPQEIAIVFNPSIAEKAIAASGAYFELVAEQCLSICLLLERRSQPQFPNPRDFRTSRPISGKPPFEVPFLKK